MFIFLISFAYSALEDDIVSAYYLDEDSFNYLDQEQGEHLILGSTNGRYDGVIGYSQQFEYSNNDKLYTNSTDTFKLYDFCVSAWIFINTTRTTGQFIISNGYTEVGVPRATGCDLSLYKNNHGTYPNNLLWRCYDGNGYNADRIVNNFQLPTNEWIHVVVNSNSSGEPLMFVNGTQYNTVVENSIASVGYEIQDNFLSLGDSYISIGWQNANFDGKIDEVYIFNKPCLQAEVDDLYNSSFGARYQDEDTKPPVINLTYPLNNTAYNDFNGSIQFITDTWAWCRLNDSSYSFNGSNGTAFHFYKDFTPLTTQNITLTITCNDSIGNEDSIEINFRIDITKPQILYYYPLNESYIDANIINFSINGYDNYAIWLINMTLENTTDTIFSEYVTNISIDNFIQYYNFTYEFNMTSYPDGLYYFKQDIYDTHTDYDIKSIIITEDKSYDLLNDYNDIYLNDKFAISLIYPKDYDVKYYTDESKVYNEITTSFSGDAYYYIEGDNIVYLPESEYPCHFIINNYAWHDCIGLNNPRVEKISNSRYKINYETTADIKQVTKSTGLLNLYSQISYFYIDRSPPNITLSYPTNNTNISYSDYTGHYTFYTDELTDCNINNSNFILQSDNDTHYDYLYSDFTVGQYNILISCNDSAGHTTELNTYFKIIAVETADSTLAQSLVLVSQIWIYVLLYIVILIIGLMQTEEYARHTIVILSAIYGILFSVYMFNNFDDGLSKIPFVIFGLFNTYLIFVRLK